MSETPDQAATRRRWITLAEVVAVGGLVIGGLTLWTNWSGRRSDAADKRTAAVAERTARGRLVLTGTVEQGGRALRLDPGDHELTDVTIAFPRTLGIAPQRPADVTIRADWIERALLALTDGGADERVGRLPVLVTARFWVGDAAHTDTGLYDLVWRTHGRLGRARAFALDGWHLRQPRADTQTMEAAWTREKP